MLAVVLCPESMHSNVSLSVRAPSAAASRVRYHQLMPSCANVKHVPSVQVMDGVFAMISKMALLEDDPAQFEHLAKLQFIDYKDKKGVFGSATALRDAARMVPYIYIYIPCHQFLI